MSPLALVSTALEQVVQWKYGTAGTVGLLLFSGGMKAQSPTATSLGAVILAVLVAGPAVSS
ncbi:MULTISPECIES: hypothetical protein [unclassified Streptomyces]|uniref:hypothetical protein n=1 Tax=unclassified Streptomyces TaxID=2593676 RepID=UPI003D74E923